MNCLFVEVVLFWDDEDAAVTFAREDGSEFASPVPAFCDEEDGFVLGVVCEEDVGAEVVHE